MAANRRVLLLILAVQINVILLSEEINQYQTQLQSIYHLLASMNYARKLRTNQVKRLKKQRQFWVRPGRFSTWWDNFINGVVIDAEWRDNFRMSKATSMSLCEELRVKLTLTISNLTVVSQPVENYTDFINRKGKYSMNIQAVCDYKYQFIDVVIKWPESVHDSRTFTNSRLNKLLMNGEISKNEKCIVDDMPSVPICIIGDAAYPLLPYLMKEFPSGGSTAAEKFFSYKLSSSRMPIKCAFSRLKGRFSILRRPIDVNMGDVPKVIHACFVLHNICEIFKEPIGEIKIAEAATFDKDNQPSCRPCRSTHNRSVMSAKAIRRVFVKYFE